MTKKTSLLNSMCRLSGDWLLLLAYKWSLVICQGIRLRGGALPGEGRVQVAYNSLYGGICSSGWNLQTASVACRQLGFGTARRIYTRSEFGQGNKNLFKTLFCFTQDDIVQKQKTIDNTVMSHWWIASVHVWSNTFIEITGYFG